jgi:hypothetical protein
LSYLFALTVLISICHRDLIALSHRRHEPLPGLRSFGFNEALKKISPTVSEDLAGPFSKRNGSLHGQPSQPSLQAARFTGHELQWDERYVWD